MGKPVPAPFVAVVVFFCGSLPAAGGGGVETGEEAEGAVEGAGWGSVGLGAWLAVRSQG